MIKNDKADTFRFLILAIVWLAMFAASYAQWQLPPLAAQIIPDFGLTMTQFSSLVTAPMIPAVLFSILAGVMCDRYGVKRVVAVGLIIGTIGVSFRFVAANYIQIVLSMTLLGFGLAFLNANLAKIIGSWFPPEQISKIMGVVLTAPTLGMTLGMGTTPLFPSIKSAYLFSGILCLLATILWIVFMKDRASDETESSSKETRPKETMSIGELLKVPAKSVALWGTGFCLMLALGAVMAFTSFLPVALTEIKGMSPVSAGGIGSIVMAGTLVSAILSPIIANKFGFYRPYFFILGLLAACGIYWAWMLDGVLLWIGMFLTGLFLGAAMPIFMSFPLLLKDIGAKYAGGAGGLMATLQLAGGIIIPTYIIIPLADGNYKIIFAFAAGCMLLMGAVALLLPELGPKATQKK